uniref:Cytochrome b561 domain-containing protein n=1 Tax=Caenorhabditis tropicalis TaxID=1561998 RepID=A0A1I7V1Y1_9PELO
MSTDSRRDRSSWNHFDILLSFTHFVGFVTICLNGYFFNTFKNGLTWPVKLNTTVLGPDTVDTLGKRGDQLHAFLMVLAFIYFQGEALLAYRVYRYDAKIVSKLLHTALHILAIGLGITALVVIIMSTNYLGYNNFTSVHSWIGICLLSVYVVQFSFGFVSYLCPCTPGSHRARLMPVHRAVGVSCFIVACVQCCLGFGNVLLEGQPDCFGSLSCANRIEYVGAFCVLSIILYTLLVLALIIPKPWRREKTPDELK